jgi:hypothetical protein
MLLSDLGLPSAISNDRDSNFGMHNYCFSFKTNLRHCWIARASTSSDFLFHPFSLKDKEKFKFKLMQTTFGPVCMGNFGHPNLRSGANTINIEHCKTAK